MSKKQIKKNQEVLFGLGILGVFATLAGASLWADKLEQRSIKESKQPATVINHDLYSEEEPVVHINLDIDGNTNTTDAVCTIYEFSPLNETDVQNILPAGTTRSLWEWSKLGAVKMLSQKAR